MSYSVEDLDSVMFGEFAIPSRYGWYSYTSEDYGSMWHLFMGEEIDDVQTALGVISYVDSYGGEGRGDDYWVVVKVTSEDGTERYFRRNGWYASHYGGELDGPTVEVRPAQKVVTVYE